MTFTFNEPYPYKGGNFVYLLYKAPSATDNDGVSFRGCYGYDKKHDGISRFDSNWQADADPLNPDATFGYSSQNMRPDIRVVFAPKAGVEAVVVNPSHAFTLNGDVLSCQSAVRVYTVNGMLVAQLAAGQSITLPRGLYIVASADGATRIAVK